MIETVMTYDEWEREYSRKKKINRKYYAKQKLVGLLMIVISVITPLLTGDATSNVERKIYNEDIKSDVLKVAHHGSSYSSTDVFLDKVKPYYAVISVGKNNIYNHPSNKTLEKLNKRNIKVYRTDLDGTILFESNGKDISVSTFDTLTNG